MVSNRTMSGICSFFERGTTGAMAELSVIFSFLSGRDLLNLVTTNRDSWHWYNVESDEDTGRLGGREMAWSVLLMRDFGRVQADLLFPRGGEIHQKVTDNIMANADCFKSLQKCLFDHPYLLSERKSTFGRTLPLLYKFLSSHPITAPLCTIYRLEICDHDYSEVLHVDRAHACVDRLAMPEDEGEQLRTRYANLLKFLVSRMTLTGGMLAELSIDHAAITTSGIQVDVYSAVGHKIDLSLFGEEYRGWGRGQEGPDNHPRSEKRKLRLALESLQFVTEYTSSKEESLEDSLETGEGSQWCRLFLDDDGRLCSFDWATKKLIPVTFESSGAFIINMSANDGRTIPFFHLTPLNNVNPHPYRLRCSLDEEEMQCKVPDRKIRNSVYSSRILQHNELCGNPKLFRSLKEEYMMTELPDSLAYTDGAQRCDGGTAPFKPSPLFAASNSRLISEHDVKNIYFRECVKNLYSLFAPYDGEHTAGLFVGCYAIHGNEVIKLSLEPFIDPRDSRKTEGAESIGKDMHTNHRWVHVENTSDLPRPLHYLDADITHCTVTEEELRGQSIFGLQLQGLKVSGDPNVPGGQLSFCFNALEALPSHYTSLPDTDTDLGHGIFNSDGDDDSLDDTFFGTSDYESAFSSSMEYVDEEAASSSSTTSEAPLQEVVLGRPVPPLVESMLSFTSESETQAKRIVEMDMARRKRSMMLTMQRRIHDMFYRASAFNSFLQLTNQALPRMYDSWNIQDRITAELAQNFNAMGQTIHPTRRAFPLDRTEHILYLLKGYASINERQGVWEPEWTKCTLVVYDRHVYQECGVVFSIIFGRRGHEEEELRSYYLDFKPFKRVDYDQ